MPGGDPSVQYAVAQKGSFQGTFAVYASATESCRFPNGI
jgi:hypothetical protein